MPIRGYPTSLRGTNTVISPSPDTRTEVAGKNRPASRTPSTNHLDEQGFIH